MAPTKLLERKTDGFHEFYDLTLNIIEGTPLRIIQQDLSITRKRPPKVKLSSVTGKIVELSISASLIKYLTYHGEPKEVCPSRIYHTQLICSHSNPTSLSMLQGLYFETKCIGSSAGGDGTYDLPRAKKTGNKLTDHLRIDDAIERFAYVTKQLGLIVDQKFTQVHNKLLWQDDTRKWEIPIYIEGTSDFFSPIKTEAYEYEVANIDLKLTSDRDSCFPPFCWGCPEKLDLTQAVMYDVLFDLPFIFLVFDYRKDNPWWKDYPIITNVDDPNPQFAQIARLRHKELWQNIRWVAGQILFWEASDWPEEPSKEACKGCPILDCSKRNLTIFT